jgi:hypothetical protein
MRRSRKARGCDGAVDAAVTKGGASKGEKKRTENKKVQSLGAIKGAASTMFHHRAIALLGVRLSQPSSRQVGSEDLTFTST